MPNIKSKKAQNWIKTYTYISQILDQLPATSASAAVSLHEAPQQDDSCSSSHSDGSCYGAASVFAAMQPPLQYTRNRDTAFICRNWSSFRLLACYARDEHLAAKDDLMHPQPIYKVINVPWPPASIRSNNFKSFSYRKEDSEDSCL